MSEYEDGMVVFYDCVTKAVFIDFRGGFHYLIGPYTTKAAAIAAGEAKCRDLGWQAVPARRAA